MNKISLLSVCATLAIVGATFGVGQGASAATPGTSNAEARYQQDRANCMSGKTAEDQKTCLKEAGAALQAAREHELKSDDADQLAANERHRCDPLSGDDKKACLERVAGEGTTTGSVAGGGELHELVTVVPGNAPDSAQSPAPMPAPAGQ